MNALDYLCYFQIGYYASHLPEANGCTLKLLVTIKIFSLSMSSGSRWTSSLTPRPCMSTSVIPYVTTDVMLPAILKYRYATTAVTDLAVWRHFYIIYSEVCIMFSYTFCKH